MFFRIIKLLNAFYLLVIGCVISLFLAYQSDKKTLSKRISEKVIEDGARNTKYTMKLKDGSITITTKRAAIKNLDRIILSDVSLFVSRGQKNLTINAQNCELEPKKKKAQLSGNILIVSPDFSAKTRMVSIDWLKGTISGNSRIDGQKDNMKFTADGFSVKKNGKIELKHARIVKA